MWTTGARPDEQTPPKEGMDLWDPGVDEVNVGRGGPVQGETRVLDQAIAVAGASSLESSPFLGVRVP